MQLEAPPLHSTDARVDSTLAIVRARYADSALSLKAVAKTLHISEEHLGRLFKRHTGQSFRQFVRNARIRKAAELLTRSAPGMKAVSALVGYSDQSHFGQDFRKYFGVTPRDFQAAFELTNRPGIHGARPITWTRP